jgi:citrate lyase subunit beta/citryl-CoA lyase
VNVKFNPDICRSLLFLPAGNERFLENALRGNADVIQIDLEDAIRPAQKEQAREDAKHALERIAQVGRVGVVRVNNEPSLLSRDLDALVGQSLAGLTIPKVSSGDDLKRIDEAITRLEENRRLPIGQIRLVAQIESASGVLNVREIANASPRLAAMGIGMEDLAAELGSSVDRNALYFPSMLLLYAAREAGVTPLGYLGSITIYNDADTFGRWIDEAKALGFEGGFCIHPNQVEILNTRFAPAADEAEQARALVEAFEARSDQGSGAFADDGRMVDKPVVDRARRTLKRYEILAGR